VLKRNPDLASYRGRDVIVGIRPEHLSDPAHSGADPEPGTARRVRDETQQADADQGEILAASVAEGVARIDPRSAIQSRSRVVFGADVERLHFFDPATAVTRRWEALGAARR
jgi:multiple sugar transport system ATP-binding protein